MASDAAGIAEATATAAGVGSDSDLGAPTEQPPTMNVGPPDPMAQMMFLLQQLIQNMPATVAAAVTNNRPSNHTDNVKLDIRNFARIKTFTNKHDAWKEWKNQFVYVIYECDNSFGDFISNLEKRKDPVDRLSDLTPVQDQLSATLFNRLQAVTTGTANAMVMSAVGNGCEAWRLLNKAFDPQTDQRLTKAIMDVVNYKIKNKDIQGGIIEWEQLVNSLTSDHQIRLDPKLLRAFLMNILPKWMQDKVMEHLDRLLTYHEVREKAIALSQMQGGDLSVNKLETQPQWPTEYDEESGCNWQWIPHQGDPTPPGTDGRAMG